MCGIAGYIGHHRPDQACIDNTLAAMRNRGPDCQRAALLGDRAQQVALLHSRLGIIDLDPRSNQPFSIGDCTLVFNGEIYNYLELRRELEAAGVVFATDSDTEVLLRCYLAYGERCVERFEGMWSFALYDANRRKLFLSRDRFAEKPLYYQKTTHGIYFGSEIKFIKALSDSRPGLNRRHLSRYLVNGYRSLNKTVETFHEGVSKVPYASSMTIADDLQPRLERYWTPRYAPVAMTMDEALEGVRHHLFESMRIRLRSDVPVAFCLSGGVDSAALTSIAAKRFGCSVKTFSIIDADERYNEYGNIMATVDDLKCEHTLIHLSTEGALERLRALIAYHDAPIATVTYLVHSYLSQAIAEQGYRVCFSGSGADEIFTGYYDHYNLHLYEMRHRPDYPDYLEAWSSHVAPVIRNPYFKNPRLYFDRPGFREHLFPHVTACREFLTGDFREPFAEHRFTDCLLRNRTMNELFHESIPTILNEEDLNSMMYSIENRSPYLDSRLFDFANSIPLEYLIRDGYAKFLLRESVRGILNDRVRCDRQKKGFNASIFSVFDLASERTKAWLLQESPVFEFVKRERIAELLQSETLCNSYSQFLFNFINCRIFLEQGL